MTEQEMLQRVREMAREDGRRNATRKPEQLLRDLGFGLANGLDTYAVSFREGFREAGGRD